MSNLEKVNPSDVAETTALFQSGVANISKKLIAVMREVGYVQKAGHNDFQNYKYATEADAIRAVRPAMVRHGLCMIPSVTDSYMDDHGNTHVNVLYRIFDEDGNFLSFEGVGCGNDKNSRGVGDKGIYKALTGANKYALLKTFLMETGDDPEIPNEQEKSFKQTPVIPAPVIEDESEELSDTRVAFVMMIKEVADTCTTEAELTELWNGNRGELEKLKAKNKESHKELIQHFKTKKEELKANG